MVYVLLGSISPLCQRTHPKVLEQLGTLHSEM